MIDEAALKKAFLSVPGGDLVDKLIAQMQKVPQIAQIFGGAGKDSSFANYNRFDWPARMLPAMNVLETGSESRSSDNGWLSGTVQIQVYWPSEFRRSDLSRVPAYFKGVLESFFSSRLLTDMLDEHWSIRRAAKVPGLNELGKTIGWSPNVEGINDGDMTPMTILDVAYRIDLRAWERALEYEGRTLEDPFEVSVWPLVEVFGDLNGVDDTEETRVAVSVDFNINEV